MSLIVILLSPTICALSFQIGQSILQSVAIEGNLKMVKYLVEKGCDIQAEDKVGDYLYFCRKLGKLQLQISLNNLGNLCGNSKFLPF